MSSRGTAMQDARVDEGLLQQALDQLEELVVAIFEEIRARPGVALAIAAGLVGAALGIRAAAGVNRRRAARAAKAARPVKRVGDVAELAGLTMRLLQNPIVRGLLLATMERQLKRRFSH